ncbi:MAG: hypothetical protein WAV09_04315 [Minisyncoccia bacterium]
MSIEKEGLEIVEKKVAGMQKIVGETQVTNEEELALVSDKIKNIKDLGKYAKKLKEEFTDPAKAIIEKAKAMFDGPIKECANAEEVLKQKAQRFLMAKEEERKKAEKKIADDLASGKIKKDETAIKKLEALPDEQKGTSTGMSGLQMTKRRVARIVDTTLIPDEYWVVDEVRVRKEALEKEKNGLPSIPGVIIEEEAGMKSTRG